MHGNRIRLASAADCETLARIDVASYREAYAGLMPDTYLHARTYEERLDYFRRLLAADRSETVAIISSGAEAAGYAYAGTSKDAELGPDYAEVYAIYLLGKYAGCGLGTLLLEWMLHRMAERGCHSASLWVLRDNKTAIRFYERRGFRADGIERVITRGIELTQLRYRKEAKSYNRGACEMESTNQQSYGRLTEITRYPVKSMAGERLDEARIAANGLYGDRIHAFVDETKEGWDSYITARQLPRLLGFTASLTGTGSEGEFPPVRIQSPDGRELLWDERLLDEIQPFVKPKLTMRSHRPDEPGLLAVDACSILIITDRTLDKLSALLGGPVDPRRFRANMTIAVSDSGSEDADLIGKRLRIGSALLQMDEPCERCMMITIDPDTLERDSSVLRKVNEELGLKFGLYASVIETGIVRVGDEVRIEE